MIAIVDVAKSGESPQLNLPAGVSTRNLGGGLYRLEYAESYNSEGHTVFLRLLKNTATRWIALIAAPRVALEWMESRLGADVYRVTPELVRDNRAQLEALGLSFDGAGRMQAPHVICGESPLVAPEEG